MDRRQTEDITSSLLWDGLKMRDRRRRGGTHRVFRRCFACGWTAAILSQRHIGGDVAVFVDTKKGREGHHLGSIGFGGAEACVLSPLLVVERRRRCWGREEGGGSSGISIDVGPCRTGSNPISHMALMSFALSRLPWTNA